MLLTGTEDIRVQKTIESIHSAFTSLLLEVPYGRITVKELCERARINKKTFYRYYGALDDLLAEIQEMYSRPYAERTAGMRYPQDVEAVTRDFLLYSAEQGELYDRIVCSSDYENILKNVLFGMEDDRYTISTPPQGWTDADWSLYMAHVTSAQMRIYRQWVEDGKKVPVERMVEIACKLICQGAEKPALPHAL